MDATMSRIMGPCANDVKRLRGKEKLRESRHMSSEKPNSRRQALETIEAALSVCETPNHPDSADMMATLVDTFLLAVRSEANKTTWHDSGFDLGNLALRILTAVERTENFQSHFCKLLSAIGLITTRSVGIWRQSIRPILNVFTNKKMDYVYLKKSVKEFKNLSKCAESRELAKFSKQNLHLLQGFSTLAYHVGDFLLQMEILEILIMYTAADESLAKAVLAFGSGRTRHLMETLDFSNFQKDSRILLNALNIGLGAQKRIFSINCNLVYFGNVPLPPAPGVDGIWMDVNRDSRRITIFCGNFLSKSDSSQCIVLQIPLTEVENLKLECGTLSGGECHCITIKISSLTEMYDFTSGPSVVCTALSGRNPREAVTEFVKMAEEISSEIQLRSDKKESYPTELQRKTEKEIEENPRPRDKPRASCTSPAVFNTGGTDKKSQKSMQMSRTSPLTLSTSSMENIKTYPGKGRGGSGKVIPTSAQPAVDIQAQQFSCSRLQTAASRQTNSLNAFSGQIESSKISIRSKLTFEKDRLPASNTVSISEERRFGDARIRENQEGNQQRSQYARRILEDWENQCEDFILTEEFKSPNADKENIPNKVNDPADVPFPRGNEKEKEKTTRKFSNSSGKDKGARTLRIQTPSLLDPNGYAYRRWLMPTTSNRSNFWLKKLKDEQKSISKPEMDIFHFNEEIELSEDSNIFLKDKTGKRKKYTRTTDSKLGKRNKVNERRKRNLRTREVEGPSKAGRRGSKSKKTLDSECTAMDTTVNAKSKFAMDVDERNVDEPSFNPDIFELRAEVCSNGKPEKGRESARRSIEPKRKETSNIKMETNTTGENDRHPPVSTTPRNRTNETRNLEDLNDIAKRLSSGFEEWTRERTEREIRHLRKYADKVTIRLNKLAEEEDHELAQRSKRFELFIQYFVRGCSLSDSIADLQAETEQVAEIVKEANGREQQLGEVTEFAGRLKETIDTATEVAFNKRMKELEIGQLEQLLFQPEGKTGFRASANLFPRR